MKLHLTTAENQNIITGYGADFIAINRVQHQHSLIVLPETLIERWSATSFAALNQHDFDIFLQLKPEVVLLGTGETHQFLHPKHFQHLAATGIALECMTTSAACRTYNILMSEGRKVAAALLI